MAPPAVSRGRTFPLYPMPPHDPQGRPEQRYRASHAEHVMACMAASLLILVLAVRYWPVPSDATPHDMAFLAPGPETIQFETVVPTAQRRQPPPPPAPLPPVIVPDDQIIEEELTLDGDFLPLEDPGLAHEVTPGDPIGAPVSGPRAETAAKAIRIVEPEYPRAAKRRKIRAEVVVNVVVDRQGRVETPTIVQRFLLGALDEPKQPVGQLGFGLEEAAISAAGRWLFQPARKDGAAVRSQHKLSFKFGI